MSYWNRLISRENFKSVTGCEGPEAYWRFEGIIWIVTGFMAAAAATVGGFVYVVYRFWQQISLEVGSKNKYGADWKTEFERYHGPLSQAHLHLIIVSLCLLSLLAIFGWVGRRFYRIHKHRRHHHAA